MMLNSFKKGEEANTLFQNCLFHCFTLAHHITPQKNLISKGKNYSERFARLLKAFNAFYNLNKLNNKKGGLC